MSIINWDMPVERFFEAGIDRGVLFLPNGRGVPWNGLISVSEDPDREINPVYFDGTKINDLVTLGEFSGSIRAFTYPNELSELEDAGEARPGLYLGSRPPQFFGLAYRTMTGTDQNGLEHYKLHIVYNITAIQRSREFSSFSEEIEPVEFEWDITAIPEEVEGFRPTASIVIDSRKFDPWLLEDLERMLYGSLTSISNLPPLQELMTFLQDWCRFHVEDNGDGTGDITAYRDSSIIDMGDGEHQVVGIKVIYLEDDVIELHDTCDINDLDWMQIFAPGDGTWIASTEEEGIITVDEDGMFTIQNANAVFVDEDTYIISS